VAEGRQCGTFSDELVAAAADVVRGWGVTVDFVAAVPSPGVVDLAARLAAQLGLPFVDAIHQVADRPSQREMANAARQVANVRGRFAVQRELPPGAALLVDDLRWSGWTLAMVGGQLRRRGAQAVFPLALATAF
jgi:ATP-dependent DNA helicase RecQ